MSAATRDIRAALTTKTVMTASIGAGLVWLVLTQLLPKLSVSHTHTGHWESPMPVVLLGLVSGLTYGVLAVGLVLIYRTNRIINFAHGQMGAFAAAFFGIEVVEWNVPYWAAFIPALILAAAVGVVVDMAVVRRLSKAPLVMSVVATLGVGQF